MSKLQIELKKALSSRWQDISTACGKIAISGDLRAVARELNAKVLRSKVDHHSGYDIKRGDALRVTDLENKKIIFSGLVWDFSKSHSETHAQIIAYDKLKFFMTSEVSEGSFIKKTAEEITKHLCKEVGVTFGECPKTTMKISVNCRGKTGYETLMQVWSMVKQTTGKPYYPVLKDGKLAVIEKGKTIPLVMMFRPEPKPGTLLDISLHESSEEACSALILTDSEGKVKEKKFNKHLAKIYGYIQRVRENTVTKDAIEINRGKVEVNCEGIGDWSAVTGYSVNLKSDFFTALMYIESDQHTYENGIHTMSLTLNYDNIMDEVENGTDNQDENVEFIESYSGEPLQYTVFGYCSCDICKSIVQPIKGKKRQKFKSVAVHQNALKAQTFYIPHFKSLQSGGNYIATDQTIGLGEKAIGVYFDSHDEAVGFGKRELTVYKGGKRTVTKVVIEHQDDSGTTVGGKRKGRGAIKGTGKATGRWMDPTRGVGDVKQNAHYHGNAIDIGCWTGTPLVAADGGKVVYAGWMGSYGNVIFINHSTGYQTRYAHLSRFLVSVGDYVSKGSLIAYSGNTGVGSGPHLHFEILPLSNLEAGIYPGPLIGR